MAEATIRELRNHGGEVVDRAARAETITITRNGLPVAELRPLCVPRKSGAAVIAAFKGSPPMDPQRLRDDIDAIPAAPFHLHGHARRAHGRSPRHR